MTDEEWFKLFDETSETFKWFWDLYIAEEVWDDLILARKKQNRLIMSCIMNEVWFDLPDSKFNIIENPKGWREFLHLIEEQ